VSDILYYEVLDIPLPELQGLKTLKIAFHHATKKEPVIYNIRLVKQSTVGDVLDEIKGKVELSHPDAELRLLEVFYHKIYKIVPPTEKIENINDKYWTLRAEEVSLLLLFCPVIECAKDILILKELLSNDSLSLPENESFHFDIPSSSRPPAKPPDDPKNSQDDGFKPSSNDGKSVDEDTSKGSGCKDQEKQDNVNSTNNFNTISSTVNTAGTNEDNELPFDLNMPALEDVGTFNFSNEDEDDDEVADINNLDTTIQVNPTPTTRIHKDHPHDQVTGDLHSATQTRNMTKNLEEHGPKAVGNAVKGNLVNAAKASACWVWKPKTKVTDHVSKYNSASITLKKFDYIDAQGRSKSDYSRCSRHMTGNISYLTDYEEIDEGYVAFGGNPKGGKITGKGSALPTDTQHTPTILQSSPSQLQKTQKPRKPKRKNTQVPQPSGSTEHVVDEVVYKELDGILVRAATTASSLEAEQDSGNIDKTQSKATPNEASSLGTTSGGGPRCQESMGDTIAQTRFDNVSKLSNDSLLARGNTLQSDKDRLKLNELMELCTNLQSRVLDLEKTNTTQALEITSLKRKVKKLEKKRRKINDIDADEDITLVNDQYDVEMFDVNDLHGEEVFVEKEVADNEVSASGEVNGASIATTVSAAVTITTEEITLAQELMEIKTAKPKAKWIVLQEPNEAVYKELDDRLMRAATTASSLEAKQDSGGPRCQEAMRDTIAQTRFENVSKQSNNSLIIRGNTLRSDEDRIKLNELMELCTNLQTKVLDLEKTKTTQALEITSLKRRVKKL
nr:ubiquitin carboxyl-terminal hydrolase 13-like [Tanacetum cinerariifolium]